jgi:hypothetical protein
VAVAGLPVSSVYFAASACAVFSLLEPGGLRTQISRADAESLAALSHAAVPDTTAIAATATATHRVEMLQADTCLPPVYIYGRLFCL